MNAAEPLSTDKDPLNRRALRDALDQAGRLPDPTRRREALQILKRYYDAGFALLRQRFDTNTIRGRELARAQSRLTDTVVGATADFVRRHMMGRPRRAPYELTIVATGGYGRAELAPYSDIDLLFIMPRRDDEEAQQLAEAILYLLWDMGFKVGQATRTIDDCIKQSLGDHTIATSLIESRPLWGDRALYDALMTRFRDKVVSKIGTDYIELKLGERNERHAKLGNTRYLVEPNLKDGKGGLRDLHALYWIAKWLYGVNKARDLVDAGFLTRAEYRALRRAENFLLSVRAGLHFEVGRAEERLTFDMQTRLAARLGYVDRDDANKSVLSAVERFMKHYFFVAKQVGDLTRIFCAVLEAREQKRALLLPFSNITLRRSVDGFKLRGGRLTLMEDDQFTRQPIDLIRIFDVSHKSGFDIHPDALRSMRSNLRLIDARLRRDPEACGYFRAILTSRDHPEIILNLMNEAGVLGRFVRDFGAVVGQMQFDMYHHFTVDAHTIHAMEVLAQLERGELAQDHPVSTQLFRKLTQRDPLYLAMFFHDIAKGRGGDHSVIGAKLVSRYAPRLGFTKAETDLAAWLVRWHLLMSNFAFKRDLTDPKTISDFVEQVQSPERLRLLIILTVVDIRAVGPGTWNGWKGQLLRDLYEAALERLVAGHAVSSRAERVSAAKATLGNTLTGWTAEALERHAARLPDSYWIAEDSRTIERNAKLAAMVDGRQHPFGLTLFVDDFQDMTKVSVFCQDHHGIFSRIAGALAVAGASVVEAKIHTTGDGMALDNFVIQATDASAFDEPERMAKLEETIRNTLAGKIKPKERLSKPSAMTDRTRAFGIEPLVIIDNNASNRSTVIEVNARDRTGLLYDLTTVFFRQNLSILSAHVATYGERAVDVFYLVDLMGGKLTEPARIAELKPLLEAAALGRKPARRRAA